MEGVWFLNEHGLWCMSCGNCIMTEREVSKGFEEPEVCDQCGFPEDVEAIADYHA